jgi:hypothetical protein
MSTERWTYTGPESAPIHFQNIRGTHGRVVVESQGGKVSRRTIKIDSLVLDIPLGLTEELHAAVSSSLRPYAGFSIFQHIMMRLDDAIDELMVFIEEPEEQEAEPEEYAAAKARCEAFCEALAEVRDSYNPDYDYEKARAMERYEARQS